jgi:5-methylcytosine-specific restriction endonuclease McrA
MSNREDYNSQEYKAWRFAVFSRDNFTCMLTGRKGGELEAHHIVRWADSPNLRYVVNNGITLSKEAHDLVTGREKEYESRFKEIVEQNNIKYFRKKNKKEKTSKPKNKFDKTKWKPRNPKLRY